MNNVNKKEIIDIIKEAILELASRNKIFHSEADFQFQLGWTIKEIDRTLEIRMERPYKIGDEDINIDIIIECNNSTYAIELKYPTSLLEYSISNEIYLLKQQDAYNQRRYDFYKDIQRLESLKANKKIKNGYALLLTNSSTFLKKPKGFHKQFDFSENHSIHPLSYSFEEGTSQGTTKGRTDAIQIINTYLCKWNKYLKLPEIYKKQKNLEFQYLLIEI